MERIYRIVTAAEWESAAKDAEYTPGDLLAGGFVHCCSAPQVEFVLTKYFPGQSDLLVLELDPSAVPAEIRYEPSEPGMPPFPHIYGPIPMSAIVAVRRS
ncbi:MAG: DUF952 domain-containing protein [Candidatus Solibacter usitatus]|nr:DUF952 domain-containing protein [Candidatus Solibacter usitatus]